MSLLDAAMRDLVREAVRDVVREEIVPLMARGRDRLDPQPRFLTVQQAANIAAVKPDTVRHWIKGGRLPEHRAGRHLRVRLDQLEAFMATDRGVDSLTDSELDKRAAELVGRRKVVG